MHSNTKEANVDVNTAFLGRWYKIEFSYFISVAVANGGGVAAGSLIALLQSAGAAGLSTGASALIGNNNYLITTLAIGSD